MQLTEHQGKQLLRDNGIPVPAGELWSDPSSVPRPFPLVVKTQILEGGRGKRGGVTVVDSMRELQAVVARYRSGTDRLPPSQDVLVEEVLDIAEELYLAILLDRDARGIVLLASRVGGIEVESQRDEDFLRVPLEVDMELPHHVHSNIARCLGVEDAARDQLRSVVAGLWSAFLHGDCLLAEVNPLVLTQDGRLVAADARVVVDDAARARHPEWPPASATSPFEARVEAAGAVGTLLDGNVAIVTSGAGLGMATVDLVASHGGRPACLVDLAGTVFRGPDALTEVLTAVRLLDTEVVFVNVFLQASRCDDVALAVRRAGAGSSSSRLVLRIRGHRAAEARVALEGFPAFVTEDLQEALREIARSVAATSLARATGARGST
jgi:succinyl-CoA synthetase beta subunit